MDYLQIQASLRRIDKKFTEELSSDEKRRAVKQFKKVYAEQISKLTMEVIKRQKLQQNMTNISEQEVQSAKKYDEQLKKRMERHSVNREKHQQNKQKQYKMSEQNWKLRLEDIQRKKKQKQMEAYRKTEKIRKDVEIYWSKKNQIKNVGKDEEEKEKDYLLRPSAFSVDKHDKKQRFWEPSPDKKNTDTRIKLSLPEVGKPKFNKIQPKIQMKTLNTSNVESTKNMEIEAHRQRSIKTNQQREEENFQRIVSKLEKIEQTRQIVQQRVEKEVQEAKRIREMKENPQYLAANRKKSIAQLLPKKKANLQSKSKASIKDSPSASRSQLDASISHHLMAKQRIAQSEFVQRQSLHERKMRKLKEGKISRMIKQAIHSIKRQTLSEKQ